MKRVLQVTGGMNRAGAETMLMNVYRAIDRSGLQFDFLVYTDKKQDYENEIISLGGRVIHITEMNPINAAYKIWEVIKNYGPYIAVHAHTLHNNAFVMLAARHNKRILRISHSHNTQNNVNTSIAKKMYEKITKIIIRKYSQVWLACGEEAGEYLFGSEFQERGKVVNNGVNLSLFNHRDVRCDLLVKELDLEGKLVIGSIARLAEVKNHVFMLEIARAMKEKQIPFKMILVGQGELKEQIQEKINEYKLDADVTLTGVRSDIPDLLQVFGVFLMPSLFEGNPVTLIEAQASGLPCVISDVITDKIDMGLDLISRCSLKDPAEKWCEQIIESAKMRCTDYDTIALKFIERKYDSNTVAQILTGFYLGGGE